MEISDGASVAVSANQMMSRSVTMDDIVDMALEHSETDDAKNLPVNKQT